MQGIPQFISGCQRHLGNQLNANAVDSFLTTVQTFIGQTLAVNIKGTGQTGNTFADGVIWNMTGTTSRVMVVGLATW